MQNRWIVPPAEGMIEPALAPEFFADHIGGIEQLSDSTVRIYYCSGQMPLFNEGLTAQHVVVARIVRPIAAIARGFIPMAQCLAAYSPAPADGAPPLKPFRPHLVR